MNEEIEGFKKMMHYEITAIEEQKKDFNRCSVFINGVFGFGITKKAVERYQLRVGQVFNTTDYEKLMITLQLDKAKLKALDMISRGNKSEKQVRERLLKTEYSSYIVEEVLAFLKKYHYIDDKALAKRYIESKSQYSHKSLRQIQTELYKKGIYLEDMKVYCEEAEKQEEENVNYFLDKFKYNPEWDLKQKQKIINRLLTRGFQYSQIEKCLRKRNEQFDA